MFKKKKKAEAASEERVPLSTTKKIVYFCLINGILWVWCSYILAFMGKEVIAETLSQVALTEIIAVVLVYALKSLFENLSRHNTWPDKHIIREVDVAETYSVEQECEPLPGYPLDDPDSCFDL